ncbi:MAG: MarR family winged helix-turn-helix transcriptional regulator [Burkholderiaceae bacterium]|nr:MarR family winged helix-turn-helix transcriptional regulator [Burkholderiaceae bacterium]
MSSGAAQRNGDSHADRRDRVGGSSGDAAHAQAPAMPPGQRALGALVGYNCRRAYLAVIEHSMKHMSEHDLRPTSFSVLSLVHHEPGLNSRQVAKALGVRPPNLVAIIASLEARKLIERRLDPADARSLGLHPTAEGSRLATRLERQLSRAEIDATAMLDDTERETLIALLARIWSSQ